MPGGLCSDLDSNLVLSVANLYCASQLNTPTGAIFNSFAILLAGVRLCREVKLIRCRLSEVSSSADPARTLQQWQVPDISCGWADGALALKHWVNHRGELLSVLEQRLRLRPKESSVTKID